MTNDDDYPISRRDLTAGLGLVSLALGVNYALDIGRLLLGGNSEDESLEGTPTTGETETPDGADTPPPTDTPEETDRPSGTPGMPDSRRVVYGRDSGPQLYDGIEILDYLTSRTSADGLPVDAEDVDAYSDGDGVEMTMIEAELEPGKPSDNSYVSVQLERGEQTRTPDSGGVDDFAVRALTGYPSSDRNVEDYIEEVLED
jgi:hypothetical protein